MNFSLRHSLLSLAICLGNYGDAAPTPSQLPAAVPLARSYIQHLFDSWKEPVPPKHIIGNIYYVGAIGVSSFLITTPEGHFLIDTGFNETVPVIEHSVAELGFKLSDIKIILSSHAHLDHTGGHARMKELTHAQIYCSAKDARVLETGGADDFIPFPRDMILYPPAHADHLVVDGEQVTLGGVTLTAHLTPGHTRGATTWTMEVTENDKLYHVVFFSSATINPGTKLLQHAAYPEIVEDFETTFKRLKELPCDIFFAPHAGQFAMLEKFAKLGRTGQPNPFIDPQGWRDLLAGSESAFRTQLEAEKNAVVGAQ